MKTTKISFTPYILSTFLGLITLISVLTSCDVLEDDPDVLDPNTDIENEVHVFSNNTSVIDLNELIKTNQTVRLEITAHPRKGDLTNLGKGLLQYVPANPSGKVTDSFTFAVFSESNQLLKTDSVIIVVENDSTLLPCAVFPLNDYVYNVPNDSAVTIDVLANDIVCSVDSADLLLSIYHPANSFPPYHGTAEVADNQIVYHPGNSYAGFDEIMYRVESSNGLVAYGFVYIQKVDTCTFQLVDDFYEVNTDSASSAGIVLPVFSNDLICETFIAIDDLHIYMAPNYGTATINSNGVVFEPIDISPSTFATDSIGYELCFGTECYRAKAYIQLRND